jgi:LPXTG-motif cell wall-anchored protein
MTSFKKIAVTSAVLATTLVAGVLSPVAVHADELTKVQAQSQNNATGDAPVVVTAEAPKTEAAATPVAAANAPEAKEDTSKAKTETNDTASKKDTQEQKKAEEKPVQIDTVKAPDKADFKTTLPYGSYEGDGVFQMPVDKYNKTEINDNFVNLSKGLFKEVTPDIELKFFGFHASDMRPVTQKIFEVDNNDNKTELRLSDYNRSVIIANRTSVIGKPTATTVNTPSYTFIFTNSVNDTNKKIVSINYDPINNKLMQQNGTEPGTYGLTQDQVEFLKNPYTFQGYKIPQRDGYITYYSRSDKFNEKTATKGTAIPEDLSNGYTESDWYVFYVKKPEDQTPPKENSGNQNPPKNDPENKNPKDQTPPKEDPVDPTIIVDPVIPAEDPVVVEKPDTEVVKPEETPDLPEAPEPAKEPEKVEVIAPAATVQAPAPAVVKAAPQAVKAAPAAKKLPQTGNSQTIKAAGLALVSLGLLGLAFADLKKKRA